MCDVKKQDAKYSLFQNVITNGALTTKPWRYNYYIWYGINAILNLCYVNLCFPLKFGFD
jgi:hypothetical protein